MKVQQQEMQADSVSAVGGRLNTQGGCSRIGGIGVCMAIQRMVSWLDLACRWPFRCGSKSFADASVSCAPPPRYPLLHQSSESATADIRAAEYPTVSRIEGVGQRTLDHVRRDTSQLQGEIRAQKAVMHVAEVAVETADTLKEELDVDNRLV